MMLVGEFCLHMCCLFFRPECESIINFQEDKADQVSCRCVIANRALLLVRLHRLLATSVFSVHTAQQDLHVYFLS